LWIEELEDRTLLASPLPLPALNPFLASQVMFSPDPEIQIVPGGTSSELLKFALHNQAASAPITFNLAPVNPATNTSQSAMALFDSDYNLLTTANAGTSAESLTVTLDTAKVYELEVFFGGPGAAGDFQLTTTLSPQVVNPTIAIDPVTGAASVPVNTFASKGDVEYYPLDLTNGGSPGTVTIAPTGLDVQVNATLLRRDNAQMPWQPIASGPQLGGVTLPLTPPAGKNPTDAQYMLAVAPMFFNSVAGSYSISVATTPLAPATVDPTTATDLLTPAPVSPGVAQAGAQGTLQNSAALYRFRAPGAGVATLTFQSSAQNALVSVYDAAGMLLPMRVASASGGQTITVSLPVTFETQYLVRVWDSGDIGSYIFNINTPYATEPAPFGPNNQGSVASANGVHVEPGTGARVFRLTPAPGTDVLAVQVSPGATDTAKFVLLGPTGVVASSPTASPGTPMYVATMVSGIAGPYDLFVEGTSGTDPVDIAVGQMQVATTLTLDQLTPTKLSLTGSLDPSSPTTATDPNGFGQFAGLKYYQFLASDQTATTTATVTGSGGARALLAHYEQDAGVFHLIGFQTPDANGQAQVTDVFTGNQLHGLAAYSLDLGSVTNPTLQFAVQTPPVAIQLGSVPDLNIVNPYPPPFPQSFGFIMDTQTVTLHQDFQQQLWQTILPQDMVDNPQVVFTPKSTQGPVQAKITVYDPGNPTFPVAGITNQSNPQNPAAAVAINLPDYNGLQGDTILLRVEPLAGNLGSGTYELTMKEATTDPKPFLVAQRAWQFANAPANFYEDDARPKSLLPFDHLTDPGTLPPNIQVIDVPQNQNGQGQLTTGGTSGPPGFTSTTAGSPDSPNPGSIAVYRFWALNPGPVTVKTVAAPGSKVNTNLHVYTAKYDPSGVLYLGTIDNFVPNSNNQPFPPESVGFDFDWYQADRSKIDAQSFINDFNIMKYTQPNTDPYSTGGGMYFVVVRNEQGSTGNYTIEVDTPPMPLGDANTNLTTYMPMKGGTISLNLPDLQPYYYPTVDANGAGYQSYLGYFPIQMPAYHHGTLTVSADEPNTNSIWDFELFDAQGNMLAASNRHFLPTVFSSVDFTVPAGEQLVYLRVRRADLLDSASVSLATQAASRVMPPVAGIAQNAPVTLLPTDPFGNATGAGELADSLSAGVARIYEFEAPAGAMTVNVAPTIANGVFLRWGAYVFDQLVAWGIGDGADATFNLPVARQPGDSPDFSFDRGPTQVVDMRIEALSGSGAFTVSVQSNVQRTPVDSDLADKPAGQPSLTETMSPPKPLRDADLAIDPVTLQGATTAPVPLVPSTTSPITTDGLKWILLSVPTRALGPVALTVNAGVLNFGQAVRYDLYDAKGNPIQGGTGTGAIPFSGLLTFSVPLAVAGHSYFLRVSLVNAPEVPLTVTASSAAQTQFSTPPGPLNNFLALGYTLDQAKPTPDGAFSVIFNTSELAPFWVGAAGKATFAATFDPGASRYLAVYRMASIIDPPVEVQAFLDYNLQLLDYQDKIDGANNCALSADLEPGLYVLRAGGSTVGVSAQLQAYPLQEMVLDPQTGHSDPPLDAADPSLAADPNPGADYGTALPLGQGFRTTFYHTEAPVGSSGGLTVTVQGTSFIQADQANGLGPTPWSGMLQAWTSDPAGGYAQVQPTDSFVSNPAPTNPKSTLANYAATVTQSAAPPQTEYWFRFERSVLAGNALVSADFTVPQSGTPDLAVTDIKLSADSGQTRVDVTLQNLGFASAPATHALFTIKDGNGHVSTSDQIEPAVGALGSVLYEFTYNPVSLSDQLSFTANSLGAVNELNYANDSDTTKLSDWDTVAPSLTLGLADTSMSVPGTTWGRYVSGTGGPGPHSDIIASVAEGSPFQVWEDLPKPGANVADGLWIPVSISAANSPNFLIAKDFQFGDLNPTHTTPDPTDPSNNPNIVKAYAEDGFGLSSPIDERQISVVPKPTWVTSITWDDASHSYQLGLHKQFISFKKDVSQILTGQDNQIPLIGSAQNDFIVQMDADKSMGLDPTVDALAPVNGLIDLTVLGDNLFNYQINGSTNITDDKNIYIYVSLDIQGSDLSANVLKVDFEFQNLQLFNYQTPEIPLFAYGIPGVLDLNVNIKFLINLALNAGVSFDLPTNPVPPPLPGLMAPTFVQPVVTLGARLSGAAQVLGIDLASVYGEVDFTLTVTFGLNTNATTVIPLQDFLDSLGNDPTKYLTTSVTGQLGLKFGAEIFGQKLMEFSPQFPPFNIAGPQGLPITTFPMLGTPPPWQPVVPPTGSTLLGPLVTDPRPNMVIDPSTGAGLYVQVADASTDPNNQYGNLSFETRSGNGASWSAPTVLTQPENVSNPVLALSHDQPTGAPAVVVYQVNTPTPGESLNTFLTGQDIRYRYWDGAAWQSEQALTAADNLYDSNPVVAFNSSGQGVAAWTHNTDNAPMTAGLDRMANQIDVAVWDPVNHVFLPPVLLTAGSAYGNSRPAVYAAPGVGGKMYLTWIAEDKTGATTLMGAVYSDGVWTTPQPLGVSGLPTGSKLTSLAMGSDGQDHIDVLMTASNSHPGSVATTALYNRASLAANFLSSQPVETVSTQSNYSFLRTTNDSGGNLVAYWEQSDGQTNDVYAAVRSAGGSWSTPTALSNDHGLKYAPAVAVEKDGTYETVFETKPDPTPTMLVGGQSVPIMAPGTSTPVSAFLQPPGPKDNTIGQLAVGGRVGMSSIKPAPELGFSQALTFASQPTATSGMRATGQAQIFNRGLVGTYVDIQYFDGIPGKGGVAVDGEDKIYLSAGNTYNVAHAFKVLPGTSSYSILVTAVDNNDQPVTEALDPGDNDNVTTASLNGLANLVVASVVLSDPTPIDGETIRIIADVKNDSDQPVGAFTVRFYQGDPLLTNQNDPLTVIGPKNVTSLAPGKDIVLSMPWTVPIGGGDFFFTVQADSKNVVTESTKADNYGHAFVSVLPDAAVVGTRTMPSPVTAKVLNYSGINNVEVDALISNLGRAGVQQVQVELLQSLDHGKYQQVATQILPSLLANSSQTIIFITSGLAGRNNYRVIVDPANALLDKNRSNNVGDAELTLEEFPDLAIPTAKFVETPTPDQGQALTVRAQIENLGIASARAISVEVFAGDPNVAGFPVGHTTLDYLAALSSTNVDIAVETSKLFGFEPLYIVVNRLDAFPETSHFNNTYVLSTYFGAPDTSPPTSSVIALPAVTATPDFLVQWQGQDFPQPGGSGIAFFDIYASVNGGSFTLWQQHTAATSATYHGLEGHSYAFYSVATDNSGNREASRGLADARTAIPAPGAQIHGTVYNDANGNRLLDAGETGLPGWSVFIDRHHTGHFVAGDPITTTDANGAYSFTGLPTGAYTLYEMPQTGWVETSPGTPAEPEPTPTDFVNATGPGMHYAWTNHGPQHGNTITIWYDFRPMGTYANVITLDEVHAAEQALQAWSDASLGKLRFVRNTTASLANIINIGFGNMLAVSSASGPSLVLSRGGAMLSTGAVHTLSNGVVWLDSAAHWDTTGSSVLPPGRYNAYQALIHEAGLALGLEENSTRTSSDMMYGFYTSGRTALSARDRADIQALYPVVPATPGTPLSLTVTVAPQQMVTGANFGNFAPAFSFARTAAGPGPSAAFAVGTDKYDNVYTAGYVTDLVNPVSTDAYVSKTSPGGQVLWTKLYGGEITLDAAFAMTVDDAGNAYVTGDYRGQVAFGNFVLTSTGVLDGFVIKMDPNGNVLWAHPFANTGNYGPPWVDRQYTLSPKSIALDNAGNVVVAGYFTGHIDFDPIAHPGQHFLDYTDGHPGGYVVKLDASGNFRWEAQALNAGDDILAFAVGVDGQNNVYTLGQFGNHNWFNDKTANNSMQPNANSLYLDGPNQASLYLWKLSANGTNAWVRTIETSAQYSIAWGLGLVIDKTGTIYTTGSFEGVNVNFDPATNQPAALLTSGAGGNVPNVFIDAVDSAGNFLWVRQVVSNGESSGEGITLDNAGNIYVTGYITANSTFGAQTIMASSPGGNSFITELTAAGDFVAAQASTSLAGSSDRGMAIAVDRDGYVDFAGTFTNQFQWFDLDQLLGDTTTNRLYVVRTKLN
jgi:hypothetical protein